VVHPIVALDYPMRVVGHLLFAVILASIFYERGAHPVLWATVLAVGGLWPQAAYLIARRSRDSKRAELRNLLGDAFIAGSWIAQSAFGLWPTTTLFTAMNIAFLSLAGVRFAAKACLVLGLGGVLTGIVGGFDVRLDSSPLTSSISIAGILLYTSVFGVLTHRQARKIIQDHRTIEERTRTLSEALEHQTVTGEIVRAISSSPTNLQLVLDAVAKHAARLCEADDAQIFRVVGDILRVAAAWGSLPLPAEAYQTGARMSRGWVTGRAVIDRQTIHVHDPAAEPDTEFPESKAYQKRFGHGTMLATPLLREGIPIGAVLLRRMQVRPFDDRHIELLKTFADQTALAIDNARLFQELEVRNRDLAEALEQQSATGEMLRVINQTTFDLGRVLEILIQRATKLCGAEHGVIYRYDGELCRLAAGYGISPELRDLVQRNPIRPGRGTVAGRVALEKRTVHIADTLADREYEWREAQQAGGYRSLLGVPMLREGVLLGVIVLWTPEVRPFTAKQIEVLTSFADQAVIAIENVRLFNQVQERTLDLERLLEEVRAMGEISQAVSASLDLREVLSAIAGHAVRLSKSDGCGIFEYNAARRAFDVVASHNLPGAFLDAIRTLPVELSQVAAGRAADIGGPVQMPDIGEAHDYPYRAITLAAGFRALLTVPMVGENVTRGMALFRRAPGRFEDRVVNLLTALANQSKVAIGNARLFQQVQSQRSQLETLSKNVEELYRVSTAMQEPLSLQEHLNRVLEAASRMGILDRLYIWAVGRDAEKLVNLAGAGFSAEEWRDFEGAEIPLAGAGALAKAFREGIPLVFNDETPLPPELRLAPPYSAIRGMRSKSFLVVPMIARGVTVGLLTGDNKPSGRPISPQTVSLLQTFASHAAVAIANARLFQAIEDKSRQLEVASRHKSEFLANMSHELRTPLNAIIGFSEVLLERMFGELNDKQAEYLQDIFSSGHHLHALINDILDLAKIEAGRMELEVTTFDLPLAIENALTLVRERASRRGISLHLDLDKRLGDFVGDERKIKQILLNLLSNAVKFTPEGGRVAVRATPAEGALGISVSDTGIGIAPENQAAIFEEFRQVGSDDARKREGTGLGLSLTKKFVEMHGGTIEVQSAVGRGSTFRVILPVRHDEVRPA
jgi:signal transduction histidine kinase